MSDVFVSASLEIRAPRPHVRGIASQVGQAAGWLWAPAQVAEIASTRDLPDGTRQLIVKDGDKLRDRVVEAGEEKVVLDSEYRPRRTEVRGRRLRYELELATGAGTTVATLGLAFEDRDAPTGVADVRRWRRHAEGCLKRLAALATAD
jgi:hypothetical protein